MVMGFSLSVTSFDHTLELQGCKASTLSAGPQPLYASFVKLALIRLDQVRCYDHQHCANFCCKSHMFPSHVSPIAQMMMLDAQGPQPLVYAASVSLEPISLD